MLRVHQLRLSLTQGSNPKQDILIPMCAKRLSIPESRIAKATVVKRSVDARDKGDVHFTVTVDVVLHDTNEQAENAIAGKFRPNEVAIVKGDSSDAHHDIFTLPLPPYAAKDTELRPIVVGAGPAGLFCALALAARGARPILIERGQAVEQRERDVAAFEATAKLDTESNVLFGEGGAGAFSDGKLTCGLSNPHIKTILQTLVTCGAPDEILTAQRPHVGTDEFRQLLGVMRHKLASLGAEIHFGHKLTGITMRNGHVASVQVSHDGTKKDIPTDTVCLAIGHSARDTYEWLYALGIPMQQKPFAIGARIEHQQKMLDRAQYGKAAGHHALPPAEYKLSTKTPDGRGVYTFCMCPGGQVIGAASEEGGINVNGMSLHARDGVNANAAVLVGITPEDFGSEHPLAGIHLQRRIEQAAYRATGSYKAPCQRVADFMVGKETKEFGDVLPTYRPGVTPSNIRVCLPAFITDNLRYSLPQLAKRMRGFDAPDAILTAPETRSSSPVRILRNEKRESAISGLYPLGEGAGYAGGIISAALDGLMAGMEI